MRISMNWLRELVELPESMKANRLADHLTMAGLEVEEIEALRDDEVLDVKITPNRPDALSHLGIARELSAILGVRLKANVPNCKEMGPSVHEVVHVNIKARDACPRYMCRLVEDIEIAQSPEWLQERLTACGMRPVNNVVDITNLVMLERGQPLHAFDFDLLAQEQGRVWIDVRLANAGEKLATLDGVERELHRDDLVIADREKAIALAGVMGGLNSEVKSTTKHVLLEAAYFAPEGVRAASKRHGLQTEGSYRFSRGVDPNGVHLALERAAEMLASICGGRVRREAIDVYPRHIDPVEIRLRPKRLAEISALPESELDGNRIRAMFLALGIETVGRSGEALTFRAPTFRPDLTREIDLIEEVMRLVGYQHVPERLYFSKRLTDASKDRLNFVKRQIAQSLTAAGFFEATNFSFGAPGRLNLFKTDSQENLIIVNNPLGEELSVMRPSLLPGLIENVLLNDRFGSHSVRLFEVGTVFLGANEYWRLQHNESWAREQLHLAGVMGGDTNVEAFDLKKRPIDFYDLKGVLVELLSSLGLDTNLMSDEVQFKRIDENQVPYLHPGSSCAVFAGDKIGHFGQLHPDISQAFQMPRPLFVFELNLHELANSVPERKAFKAVAKYPAVERDLAVVVAEEVGVDQLVGELKTLEVKNRLEEIKVFDVYRGKGVPTGHKSVALSFRFREPQRTLTDDEIAQAMESIVNCFKQNLSAEIR